MYESYYGFSKAPFSINPDPAFLYLNPTYREAIALLQYGIQEHKGIVTLIGEVGTGKTMLLNLLLESLGDAAEAVMIPTTRFKYDELIDYLLNKLKAPHSAFPGKTRYDVLYEMLSARNAADEPVVVLVDETQDLDYETLESIRLLSNIETPSRKLLQIVLVGQPELRNKLNSPELRQLKQRIAVSFTLQPLSAEEIPLYIAHRLQRAGYPHGTALFTSDALTLISTYSKGIPRLINAICDNALLIGFAASKRWIDAPVIKEAANDLLLESQEAESATASEDIDATLKAVSPQLGSGARRTRFHGLRWVLAIGALLVAIGAGYASLRFGPTHWQERFRELSKFLMDKYESDVLGIWSWFGSSEGGESIQVAAPKSTEAVEPVAAARSPETSQQGKSVYGDTDAARPSDPLSPASGDVHKAHGDMQDGRNRDIGVAPSSEASGREPGVQQPPITEGSPAAEEAVRSGVKLGDDEPAPPRLPAQPGQARTTEPIAESEGSVGESEASDMGAPAIDSTRSHLPGLNVTVTHLEPGSEAKAFDESDRSSNEERGTKRRLRSGDTITSIARQVYGDVGLYELTAIKMANPEIRDLDLVELGLEVVIPDLASGVMVVNHDDGSADALLGASRSLRLAERLQTISTEQGMSTSITADKLTQTIEVYRLETSDHSDPRSSSPRMNELNALRAMLAGYEE